MKNIIKTDNYLLIVSDEEIKEGDWVVNTANNYISFSAEEAKDLNRFTHVKKIIAHLPLNGGYNKAKEKYKYTEEDMRKAWNTAYIDAMSIDEETYKPLFFEDFIQSLSQPKMPIGFERELVNIMGKGEPITERNSQGHIQWVGTYIFN